AILSEVLKDDARLDFLRAKGVLHVWEVGTGKNKMQRPLAVPVFFSKSTVSKDGKWIAICDHTGTTALLIDTVTGKVEPIDNVYIDRSTRLAFAADGQALGVSASN